MTDNTPLYDRIPTIDDPTGTHANKSTRDRYSSAQNSTSSAMDSEVRVRSLGGLNLNPITDHHFVQLLIGNGFYEPERQEHVEQWWGPVARQVKSELASTQSEFQNLADARRTRPSQTTATGQPLTHYHSMVYSLLSWDNPRATTVAYLSTVAFIFAARYLPIVRYLFKILYLTLGVTATAEVVGKGLFSNGFTTQVRPRRYYTLPKESVERAMDDVHELLNFFVIESQRILFAENVGYTIAAFFASLLSYFLIKVVPLWGLGLIGTSILYLGPLIYFSNKEIIDEQLANLSRVMNQQAHQVKDLAGHHTARATETVKAYAGDYSAKAQEYIGHAKQRTASATQDASAKTQDYLGSAKDRTASATQDASAKSQDYLGSAKNRTASAAQDTSAKTQDYLGSAKDRTASATQDASAKTQDYLGSAKDRTASATNDYSANGQDYLGSATDRAASGTNSTSSPLAGNKQGPGSSYKSSDFPSIPTNDPTPIADQFNSSAHSEPKIDQGPLMAS